jgi:hypothetical protein
MVVEVPVRRLVAKAHIDAEIGLRESVAVARAHHLDGLAEQAERGEGENLVRVKGTVMGRDQHPARL